MRIIKKILAVGAWATIAAIVIGIIWAFIVVPLTMSTDTNAPWKKSPAESNKQ